MGICISVLNLKGGVGKTTVSAHVMRVLYHRHQKSTLLVDLDPQFNLSQCLLTRTRYDAVLAESKSVLIAMEPPSKVSLFDVATEHKAPPKATEIATNLRQISDSEIKLQIIPGDFKLIKYSLVSDKSKLDAARQRFLQFISQAKKEYDLVVIDCNPSSSFITLCALHACDHILVPVRPDKYSILGLELLAKLLDEVPTIVPKPEISILLNGVRRNSKPTDVELQLRSHTKFGALVYENPLRQSGLLEAHQKFTGFATDRPVAYKELLKIEIASIVDEIVSRVGLTV